MSRKHHNLKTETEFFQAVERKEKKFELRLNDRDYKKGDILHLHETVNGIYTGRKINGLEVIYIFYGGKFGLNEEYCIMCFNH